MMKKDFVNKRIYPVLILALFIIIDSGCEQKQDDIFIWEISPDSETAIIQKEVEGIEFKFCLLNEQNEPTTVFNQDENFTFSFSFKNQMQDTVIVTTEFINSDFYRVYQAQTNIDMGKPWTGVFCLYLLGPREYVLSPLSERIQLNCPWVITDEDKPDYPLCASESKEYLPKGEYYTTIDLDFHFTKNGKKFIINNKIFKINFIIQ
ncbi:MAG: hypothetical protein ACQERS_09805 [Bacteroidota bacterium]